MRYNNMDELRRNLSPDVVIEDDDVRRSPIVSDTIRVASAHNPPPKNTKVLEDKFLSIWQSMGGVDLVREHRFHATRRWRFDFAIPDRKIAFEIQGGMHQAQSGHRSMTGVMRDAEKLNEALLAGWVVFQINSRSMKDRDFMLRLIHYCLPF